MNTSENINELAAALAAAQGQITGARKGSTNPHFKSQYSDLAAVIEAIREPLSSNGLSYVQGMGQTVDGSPMMTTRLMHASGQWIECTASIPIGQKVNAQTTGSACSYLRRYSLQSLIGLPSIDDDANVACAASESVLEASAPHVINPQQFKAVTAALKVCPEGTEAGLLKALRIDNVAAIPAVRFDWVMAKLKEKAA